MPFTPDYTCTDCGQKDPFKFGPRSKHLCEPCWVYANKDKPEVSENSKWLCKGCGETDSEEFYGRRISMCKACVNLEKAEKKKERIELETALFMRTNIY